MANRRCTLRPVLTFGLAALAWAANATESTGTAWQTPIISYGAVVELPDAAVQLSPKKTYNVLFHAAQAAKQPDQVIPGLERAARFLNLAALAKVPKGNINIVVTVQGKATISVLSDKAYRERQGRSNPNLDLLAQLKDLGVKIFVCGQALAHHKLDAGLVSSDVDVAVAGLTVLAQYQMDGYVLIPD